MNTRALGRSVAIVVAMCVLALLGIAWIISPKPSKKNAGGGSLDGSPPPSTQPADAGVIDPMDLGGNPEQLIQEGGRGQWTGRLSADGAFYRLTYQHLEPREEGVIELSLIDVWLPGDEQSIVIRADEARMRRPRGEREPTDGRVSGGVNADIYAGRVEDEATARTAHRLARVNLDSMTFERDRLLLSTEDDVRITGDGIDALLRGLSASLSEDESPLRLLRVPRGGFVRITPDLMAQAQRESSTGGDKASPANDAPGESADRDASFYELVLNTAVKAEAQSATAAGGSARVLAALIDGRLPDDALAPFDIVEDEEPSGSPGDRAPARPQARNDTQRYDISWEGPLELRPLPDRPDELVDNALHIAINAGNAEAPARVAASSIGVDATAETIAYAATQRRIALSGGGGPEGVRIVLPDTGEFVGTALEMDLTTGVGSAAGAHVVRALGRASGASDPLAIGPEPIELISTGRTDFHIDTRLGPVGSGAPIYPRSLIFTDGVEAHASGSMLAGETIRAAFTDASSPAPGSLAGISVMGHARAQDGRDAWIESDEIDILFAPDPLRDDRPAPFSARASGDEDAPIRAGTGHATLAAHRLEAEIVPDADGDPQIGEFTIRERVRVQLADGAGASADLISGDARTRRAELTGAPATIERADDSGAVSLSAETFTLDGEARTLSVAGPGTGRASSMTDGLARTVDLSWERSLHFDDARGRAEVAGGVEVQAEERLTDEHGVNGLRTHHATGQRVTLDLAVTERNSSARELTRALLEGALDEADWARVETRVYAFGEGDARRLLGVLFVSGPLMDARPGEQAVAVAGPGRLLVDQRASADDATMIGASPDALETSRGTSLFEWKERLDLDGGAGLARMRGEVSFRHLDPMTGIVTDLRADDLGANFTLNGQSERAQLRDVTATGSVVVRHADLQIVADAARYDAQTGEILARGENGRRVTILDNKSGRQDEAGAIRLNLETGAWSVTDPGSVTIQLP